MITEYESQHELNPSLWLGHELRPMVRIGLIKIAKAFYDFLEVDVDILDVILIGSNANYNWTRWSDIDLHVVINYMNVGDNMHIVSNYMHAKKSVWNVNYPLQYQGMNIELYAQDSNQLVMNGFVIVNAFVEVGITKGLSVNLSANNLFDTLAITEAEEGNITDNTVNYIRARPMPGRSMSMALSYRF